MRLCFAALLGLFTLLPPSAPAVADGLSQALQAAMQRNPAVLGKRAQRQSYELRIEEAEAQRLPSLTVEADSLTNASNHGQVVVRQPLWAFGKIDGAIDLATARAEQSRAELLQSSRQLLEDTAAAYCQIIGLQARRQAAERNVDEHRRLLALIERRRRGGVASEADERLASSRLITATATLAQLQGALDAAQHELYALARTRLADYDPIAPALTTLPPEGALQAEADRQDAGIQLKRIALVVAERALSQVKAELLPTLYAQVEHDIAASSASGYSPTRVGLVLSARLDGFGVVGSKRVKAEAALINAATEELESARNEAQRRISTLMAQRTTQGQLILAQEQALAAVEDTLASYLRQFDAGRKSWLDVLNTQRELADVRQQLESARSEWQAHTLRLGALSGRLDTLAGLIP